MQENKTAGNTNILSTFVDASIGTIFLAGKVGWQFTKWCFDGWISFDNHRFDILFEEAKLYNSNARNKPILKKENHTDKTDVYIFTIPTGLSIEDFTKKKEAIAQFLKTDLQHLKIENINNLAAVTVFKGDKVQYNYEDYNFPIKRDIEIPIGISLENWNVIYWKPTDPNEVHLFCGGSTGSGKSNALNVIVTFLIEYRNDIEIYIQDCKMVDLLAFKDSNKTKVYNQGSDYAEETVIELVEEMQRRYKYLAENKCKCMADCMKKDRPNFIFYVLDELNLFSPKEDAGFYKNLALLLSQGRAAGIICILASQSCYSTLLPGEMKNNIVTTLGLRTKTQEVSKVVCGDYEELINLRGKGHGKLFTADRVQELQVFNIKEETIEKVVATNKKTESEKETGDSISADYEILD